MKRIIIGIFMLCAAAAFAAGAKDEEKLKAAFAKVDEAWNKGDGKAYAAAFSDDCVVVSPSGTPAKGRAELEKIIGELTAGPMKGTTHKLSVASIHFIKDDIAVLDGDGEVTGIKGMPVTSTKAKFTAVATRSKGNWTITDLRGYVHMPALAAPSPAPVPPPK